MSPGVHERVGRRSPNKFGLFDILGNVREWCLIVPRPPELADQVVVVRGGSWRSYPRDATFSSKSHESPTYYRHDIGVRPCRPVRGD